MTKQSSPKDLARYSIRLASRMSGVSAHTLRMWERRYGYPIPVRTEGGARRYTDDDVATLKLVAQALETGYRPGDVVGKRGPELRELIAEQVPMMSANVDPPELDRLLAAVKQDDVVGFTKLLEEAVAAVGPKRFVVEVARPLAVAIGDAWALGEIAIRQEHLASNILASQLRVLITAIDTPASAPRVLLTTLPDERHGLALDMVSLYLCMEGATPLSLGVSTPVREIATAALALDADVVGISVSAAAPSKVVLQASEKLIGELPRRVELWFGGGGVPDLDVTALGAHAATSWSELDAHLARWRSLN